MVRGPMFVVLEDESHVLVGDEHTACGLLVPHGTDWVTARPDKLCAECAEKALGETPTGKPKDTDREPMFPNPDVETEPAVEPAPAPKAKAKTSGKSKA